MSEHKNEYFAAVIIMIVAGFAIGFMPLPQDPDLWFHLASGEYILTHGHVPQTDPFSFTRGGEFWMPHSWLFDVLAALSWHHLGPRSTEAIMGLCFMATLILCFYLLSRRSVSPVTALGVCFFLAIASGNTRGVRPQVISLLLTAVMLALLARHQARPSWRIVWMLPLLFLTWAQMHGGCVMGLIVLSVVIFGRLLDYVSQKSPSPKPELKPLVIALLISSILILITPHAISHYEYVRLTMGLDFLKSSVVEWQPPHAWPLAVPDVYFFMLIGAVLVVLSRYKSKVSWADLSVCGALILLAGTATRHIPLACIGSVPLFASALSARTDSRVVTFTQPRRAMLVPACFVVVLLVSLWRYPNDIWSRYTQAEPIIGARALANMEKPLRVFTTYNTGPYVLWTKPGTLQIFVDSRADLYGDKLLRQAERARAGHHWQEVFARWSVQAAVVEKTDPIAHELLKADDWKLLAEDHQELTFILRGMKPSSMVSAIDDRRDELLTPVNMDSARR